MGRSRFNIDLNKISKHINYRYGLAKENEQRVIYLTGRGWVRPKIVDEHCEERIAKINRKFNRLVIKYLANDELFRRNFISDFSVPLNKFQMDKKKFMQFECYFRQVKDVPINELQEDMERGVKRLTRELENVISDNEFQVTKTK